VNVFGDHVGATLRLREMVENDDRDGLKPELPRGFEPAVTGDHLAIARDQDRVGPTELDDARCDLRHLLRRVGPRVARIGRQPIEGPLLDPFRRKAQRHRVRGRRDGAEWNRLGLRGGLRLDSQVASGSQPASQRSRQENLLKSDGYGDPESCGGLRAGLRKPSRSHLRQPEKQQRVKALRLP
jgi:hypothetical protein